MTDERMERLRSEIKAHMEAEKLSQTIVAKQTGVSAATLNQWLQGKYKGDQAGVAEALERWLANSKSRRSGQGALPQAPGFVPTPTTHRIQQTLAYAQAAGDVVLIFGGAGLGKTQALRNYAATNNNVWLGTASPAKSSVWGALQEVAELVGINDFHGRKNNLQNAVVKRITDTMGLIVIDEAQHFTLGALDMVRAIHDQTEVGLALVGNETVYSRMTGGGARAAYLDRLFSRVGKQIQLTKPYKDDVVALAKAWGITDEEIVRTFRRIAATPGGLRTMTKVLRLAGMYAASQGQEITLHDVTYAWDELQGNHDRKIS